MRRAAHHLLSKEASSCHLLIQRAEAGLMMYNVLEDSRVRLVIGFYLNHILTLIFY